MRQAPDLAVSIAVRERAQVGRLFELLMTPFALDLLR
jgi:hypothetical protein